jgi:integrase
MQIAFKPARKRPWYVDLRAVGGGQRFFLTEKEAKDAVKAASKDRQEIGREWADLAPRDRLKVVRILDEMKAAGTTLETVWAAWKAKEIAAPRTGPTLGAAITQLVAAKREANLRSAYIDGLENYLESFAKGREKIPVDAITADDVLDWFTARAEKPATKASNIGRLSALFTFAIRRRWRTDNPVDVVERPRLEGRPPQILTVRQAAKVLVWVKRKHPKGLAWFALALMAGIRPEECDRLSWDAVNLKDGIVTIDAAASKVRRRRIVHLQPAAVAWLKLAKELKADLPLAFITRRRYLRGLRAKLGFASWPQDILRHTCASYLMAQWQDAGRVAAELGNSAGVLLRHYRELVRREDAERFWKLMPQAPDRLSHHA